MITSFAALEPLFETVSTAEGEARVLNLVGTALHLVVHGYRRPALRDVYLLARLLQQMSAGEQKALRDLLTQERCEPLRMQALVAAAASFSGLEWPCDARTQRFVQWMIRREDLPRPLRTRPDCYDAWLASHKGRVRAVLAAAWRYGDLEHAGADAAARARLALRPIARLSSGALISAYIRFMRPA